MKKFRISIPGQFGKATKYFLARAFLLFLATDCFSAISIGPGGVATTTFDTLPTVAQGWATRAVPGAAGDIVDAASLNTEVQTYSASLITDPLGSSTANLPPSLPSAVWSTSGYVQT